MSARRQVLLLAVVLGFFWLTYGAALYVQFHPGPLSREAHGYSELLDELHGGLSLKFALQKLCFATGLALLLLGSVLLPERKRIGAIYFSLAALPLAATIPLGEPQPYYPALEGALSGFLWCGSGALWGVTATLGWTFSSRGMKDAAGSEA